MNRSNPYLLYAITDEHCIGKKDFIEAVEESLAGGITMLQLRDKTHDFADLIRTAKRLQPLCHRYGVPLIINDFPEVAIESGADGVHVGAEDAAVASVRALAGRSLLIGATAKTLARAEQAEAEGADYLGCGAMFPSPTKQNALPMTKETLQTICQRVKIPVVAIGGITEQNISLLRGCGACGAAVISAVFAAEDIKSAAGRLRTQAEAIFHPPLPTNHSTA